MQTNRFTMDVAALAKETRVFFYKSSGPGGQRKNKRETAVKLHHIPSGVWVIATEARSQVQNKRLAFHRLKERLAHLSKKRKQRISTTKSLASYEAVLAGKKLRAKKKQLRKRVNIADDY